MATETATIALPRSAEEVWAEVGNFDDLHKWMSGVEECRTEGDIRYVKVMGMDVTERLVARDDTSRSLSYSITDGVPVSAHKATITVTPDGDGCIITWEVTAEPVEMLPLLRDVYQDALNQLT